MLLLWKKKQYLFTSRRHTLGLNLKVNLCYTIKCSFYCITAWGGDKVSHLSTSSESPAHANRNGTLERKASSQTTSQIDDDLDGKRTWHTSRQCQWVVGYCDCVYLCLPGLTCCKDNGFCLKNDCFSSFIFRKQLDLLLTLFRFYLFKFSIDY